MKSVVHRLEAMLKWSDRIGSDEIEKIKVIITLLEKQKNE